MNEQKDSASEGVSEAVPEIKPCPKCNVDCPQLSTNQRRNYVIFCRACGIELEENDHEGDVALIARWNARVHQPPEQNSEDKNSVSPQPTTLSHSSVVVSGDSSLDADLCVLCGHNNVGPWFDRRCVALVPLIDKEPHGCKPCKCACIFPNDAVCTCGEGDACSRCGRIRTTTQSILRIPTDENTVAWAELAAELESVLRELSDRFNGVDSGHCTLCVGGFRLYDTKGKVQPCDNKGCFSYRIAAVLDGKPSTSDVLGNPERGKSVRNQTESSSESESTLVTVDEAARRAAEKILDDERFSIWEKIPRREEFVQQFAEIIATAMKENQ